MIVEYDSIVSEYFSWLCDLAGINNSMHSYFLLASKLHELVFYYTDIKHDKNRATDGLKLRDDFLDEKFPEDNYDYYLASRYINEHPCTVFEMLIALAYRISETVIFDEEDYDGVYWFWKMIENLGIDIYNDDDYYDLNPDDIERIIDNLLDRNYEYNGEGGLFPLIRPETDQRDVEIWFQMESYLLENYEVE